MHRTAAALAASGLLLLSACSGGGDEKADATGATTPAGATVHLAITLLKPGEVSMKAGQALTFVNDQAITHEMVGGSWKADPGTGLRTEEKEDGTFSLTLDKKGQQASHTFDMPGTYTYFCTIHKGMNGTVTVG